MGSPTWAEQQFFNYAVYLYPGLTFLDAHTNAKPQTLAATFFMTPSTDIYFEIFDGGDLIRLEPIQVYDNTSQLDWDRNWVKTKVTVKGGLFSGQFTADFLTTDFELFKRDLRNLDKDFKGTAKLEPLEGQLILNIAGDGLGHFEVDCKATDQPGYGRTLAFTLSFDQTELSRLINELDQITKAFPITGDSRIHNE